MVKRKIVETSSSNKVIVVESSEMEVEVLFRDTETGENGQVQMEEEGNNMGVEEETVEIAMEEEVYEEEMVEGPPENNQADSAFQMDDDGVEEENEDETMEEEVSYIKYYQDFMPGPSTHGLQSLSSTVRSDYIRFPAYIPKNIPHPAMGLPYRNPAPPQGLRTDYIVVPNVPQVQPPRTPNEIINQLWEIQRMNAIEHRNRHRSRSRDRRSQSESENRPRTEKSCILCKIVYSKG